MSDVDWVVLFGAPGVGKTTVAQKMQSFGYFYFEADSMLLPEVVALNKNNKGLTTELRGRQHEIIFDRLDLLTSQHNKLVMAYDFMWDRYRRQLSERMPKLRWVYLTIDEDALAGRIDRPGHILTPEFALEIYQKFEEPSFRVQRVDASKNIEAVLAEVLQIEHT